MTNNHHDENAIKDDGLGLAVNDVDIDPQMVYVDEIYECIQSNNNDKKNLSIDDLSIEDEEDSGY